MSGEYPSVVSDLLQRVAIIEHTLKKQRQAIDGLAAVVDDLEQTLGAGHVQPNVYRRLRAALEALR